MASKPLSSSFSSSHPIYSAPASLASSSASLTASTSSSSSTPFTFPPTASAPPARHGVGRSGSRLGHHSMMVDLLPSPLANTHAVAQQIAFGINGVSPTIPTKKRIRLPPLSCTAKWSYGVGHVLNDLVASCWFSYVLVFFRAVLSFSPPHAGLLLLIGQVADGIATPVVGFLSDKTNSASLSSSSSSFASSRSLPARFHPQLQTLMNHDAIDAREPASSPTPPKRISRKTWIGFGSLIVAATFPPIFHRDIFGFTEDESLFKVLYFSFFIVLLQFAWAAVQVSHLALVPDLTRKDSQKVYLNSLRSFFTILSNVAVFTLAWLILSQNESSSPASSSSSLSSSSSSDETSVISLNASDAHSFFILSVIVSCLGLLFTVIFLCGTPDPRQRPRLHGDAAAKEWHHWFADLRFYQTAVVYTCTRLLVNVGQTYMPLFLLTALHAPKSSIASVPLVVFGAGLMTTTLCQALTKRIGTRYLTMAGCAVALVACTVVRFSTTFSWVTYSIALLLGSATGLLGVSSLSLICELVGDECESSAFVYGSMSFVDKISGGVAIMIIETLSVHHSVTDGSDASSAPYYTNVMTYVPGGAALVAIIILLFMIVSTGSGLRQEYAPITDKNTGKVNGIHGVEEELGMEEEEDEEEDEAEARPMLPARTRSVDSIVAGVSETHPYRNGPQIDFPQS